MPGRPAYEAERNGLLFPGGCEWLVSEEGDDSLGFILRAFGKNEDF
jgi:hypothetical protein